MWNCHAIDMRLLSWQGRCGQGRSLQAASAARRYPEVPRAGRTTGWVLLPLAGESAQVRRTGQVDGSTRRR